MNTQISFTEEKLLQIKRTWTYKRNNEYEQQVVYICGEIPIEKIKSAKSLLEIDIHDKIHYLVDRTVTHWFDNDEICLCAFTNDSIYIYSDFLQGSDKSKGVKLTLMWKDIDKVELIESEYLFYINESEYYSIPSWIICGNLDNESNCFRLLEMITEHYENTEKKKLEELNNQITDLERKIEKLLDDNLNISNPKEAIKLADEIINLYPLSFNACYIKSMALFQINKFKESLDVIENYARSIFNYYKKNSYDEFKLEANDDDKSIICMIGERQFLSYYQLGEYEKAVISFNDLKYYWGGDTEFPELYMDKFQEIYPKYIYYLLSKDINKRKILYASDIFLPVKSKNFITIQADFKTNLIFPLGLPPVAGELYVAHPHINNLYYHISDYEKLLFVDKVMELTYLLQCLGAKSISIRCINGEDVNEYNKKELNVSGEISAIKKIKVEGGKFNDNLEDRKSKREIQAVQEFAPTDQPYVPDNLIWYEHDIIWRRLVENRLKGNLLKSSIKISTSEVDIVSNNEKIQFEAEFKAILFKIGVNYSDQKLFRGKKDIKTEWQIDVEFEPKELLKTNKEIQENKPKIQLFVHEEEYAKYYRECLNNGEISFEDRRILKRLKENLKISDSRVNEIETIINSSLELTEPENEYYREVLFCIKDDGSISDKERRYLDTIKTKLDIGDERAIQIESIAKQK